MTIEHHEEEGQAPTSENIMPEDQEFEGQDNDLTPEEEQENREDSRFKEGQSLQFVRVRFPGNSRSFAFLVGKRHIEYGQKVVAMSDRGMAVGYVNSFPYEVFFNKSMLPVRSISKVANEEDIVKDRDAYHRQKNAENICNDLIEEYHLDMHLTHVEFTSFGKKAVFYFIAPARVDFRDLVKELVGRLKTRIELRQISVRDRSASVGGLGPCGRELCCSSFLTKYGNVGIKMAKNQDLTLNFSKLNGVCGQLKCCLQYEDEVYREKRSRLPREGDIISTHTNEIGRVDRLHLLSEQFVMMTNRGVRKRFVADLYKDTLNKEEANFPKEFESVSDETHKVIGLDEAEAKKVAQFESEVKTHKEASKKYADSIFEGLFGEKSLGISLPEVLEPESSVKNRFINPEEEEELSYTPNEEDTLDDEEDSYKAPNRGAVQQARVSAPRDPRDRPQGQPRQQNQNNENRNRPQPNRGGERPQGANPNQSPNQTQNRRPDNRNQNQGPRPGPNPNNNQNRTQNSRGPKPPSR